MLFFDLILWREFKIFVITQSAKAQTLGAAAAPVLPEDVKPVDSSVAVGSSGENMNEILKKLINQAPVMLFMKGNAENPQCGMLLQTKEE